jgi:hypothetical protein
LCKAAILLLQRCKEEIPFLIFLSVVSGDLKSKTPGMLSAVFLGKNGLTALFLCA